MYGWRLIVEMLGTMQPLHCLVPGSGTVQERSCKHFSAHLASSATRTRRPTPSLPSKPLNSPRCWRDAASDLSPNNALTWK